MRISPRFLIAAMTAAAFAAGKRERKRGRAALLPCFVALEAGEFVEGAPCLQIDQSHEGFNADQQVCFT